MTKAADTKFDYIVIGAGSAGCVLANRLSTDPARRVCLIEAGPSDRRFPARLLTRVPAGIAALLQMKRYNYGFSFDPDPRLGDMPIPLPRGRMVGGTSSINGMVYMRGNRRDYDGWAAAGNAGWSYDEVLPLFRRAENWQGPPSAYHGTEGELDVSPPQDPHPICDAFIKAAEQLQYPRNPDFNGAEQAGFGLYHLTQRRGERVSAARAFLDPVLSRPNLRLMTDTPVAQILVENGRASGVRLRSGDTLTATREVVLSAGTVHSPQLLMLSGIGPAEHLRDHGIAVVHDLAGVGEGLQDHQNVLMQFSSSDSHLYGISLKALPRILAAPFRYLLHRKGPLSSNLIEAAGYVKSRPDLEIPDLQICIGPGYLQENDHILPRGHGFSFFVTLMQSLSRGTIRLRSADLDAAPLITSNFLSEPSETAALVEGIRIVRRLAATPPLTSYQGREIWSGLAAESDADLADAVHRQISTAYHPVGTCRMGIDERAVVGPDLAVHGLRGLRVADASVMPELISGNTNAPTMMIAEKLAEILCAEVGEATLFDLQN